MTRVVAGTRRGRRIMAPAGRGTRPTSDRVREALFSSLESMIDMDGSRFADLYAGSGAVGLEAGSRGAAAVLFVESDPKAARCIRDNIAALGLGAVCRLVPVRVATVVNGEPDHPYDVVFADPPYDADDGEVNGVLAALVANGWLAPGGVVVVERSSRSPQPVWPDGVTSERGRRYGESTLWYGRRA